ncbi:invasion associated locus B family protein [Tardiphaga sp. 709]|uniref:invasion associated locus B family protein n=1 Tax=Tardiphaga sp. 709 TaxID=3076039 RepID=UPI0028EE5FD7|nr:invasion associated locus B family protein [Tardiphaga sp. 709]WNV07781.1 invasion associated locus B family protein [Tardiphaga sp. 709]
MAALLLAASTNIVFSQSVASQPGPLPALTGTEISPRGRRDVKDVTFGDWKKVCFKPGGAKVLCRTSITGIFSTGQMAVRLDITEREGDTARRIQIFSPVGMYLPNPVELVIDQGKPYRFPYTWCLTNACIAGAKAPSPLIKEMKQGRILRLQFVDSSLLLLTTSVPLSPFSAVYKGAPAQTFEQDIDE